MINLANYNEVMQQQPLAEIGHDIERLNLRHSMASFLELKTIGAKAKSTTDKEIIFLLYLDLYNFSTTAS